jgi:hypothetical protein
MTDSEYKIGRDAGWILTFHQEIRDGVANDPILELSRDDYYGDIQASLPTGLEGGLYTFTLEGVTDKHYATIAQTSPDAPSVVRLFLYYRDLEAPDLGIATSLLGSDFLSTGASKWEKHQKDLVAELRIVSVTRRAGSRKYEATITARERVYDAAAKKRPCGEPIDAKEIQPAVKELMRRAALFPDDSTIPLKFYDLRKRTTPAPPVPTEEDGERFIDAKQPILGALNQLAERMETESGLFGRGMLLIRDGTLHVGPRPIPLIDSSPPARPLTLANGLIESNALEPEPVDPNWDACDPASKQPQEMRAVHRLILRGRPDLKPGDLIVFDAPKEDVSSTKPALGGAFGALGDVVSSAVASVGSLIGSQSMDNPVKLYLRSVEHKLSRTAGFLTTAIGIEIKGDGKNPDDMWDYHSYIDTAGVKPTVKQASPELQAGKSISAFFERALQKLAGPEIAEVRDVRPKNDGAKPGQTELIWRGLTPGFVGANNSRNADIQRPTNSAAESVPYATPFAWGKCGLVLPRYPGMRVVVAHRDFKTDDPVDIGATWQTGHQPVEAQLGDWWLILPAESPTGNAPTKDQAGAPNDYVGKVSHDLIDQAGNRVIAVGAFAIRVGDAALGDLAGNDPLRPKPADSGIALLIEHPTKNVRIAITNDGDIKISGGNIEINASSRLKITAKTVEVNCHSMEVK